MGPEQRESLSGTDARTLQEAKEKYKHPTVPIVILRENGEEKLIGGCTETLRLLKGDEK